MWTHSGSRLLVISTVAMAMVGSMVASFGLGPGVGTAKELHTMSEKADGYSASGFRVDRYSDERIAELAEKLTEEEKRVILNDGTEPAFCGNLVDNKKEGVYLCRLCGLPLFSSDSKFTSGTGWPS
ncbi:MAG: peptide-methionine (R)-S-oxide reductase, partial [Phycisphaerales bacterium]|nr:peptide-methionine (R)-S-oxide reductase [Phycisphaerales bacterium]